VAGIADDRALVLSGVDFCAGHGCNVEELLLGGRDFRKALTKASVHGSALLDIELGKAGRRGSLKPEFRRMFWIQGSQGNDDDVVVSCLKTLVIES
jgi:hypothetical protein